MGGEMTLSFDPIKQHRPIIVIGAAFGDIMLGVHALPTSGDDVVANQLGRQISGCALNVARALARLSLKPINAIPVGNGVWGEAVANQMDNEGLPLLLLHPTHDNGWCLAIVEDSHERTFITIEGCEQHWSKELLNQVPQETNALVYVSGYELVSPQSEPLRQWLLNLSDDKQIFVDFGPRLADIDASFIRKLLTKKPILTINRDELTMLNALFDETSHETPLTQAQLFAKQHHVAMICRFDIEGATVVEEGNEPKQLPAYTVTVSDTIGAGDSHCAGTLAGLACGLDLPESTRLGNMVAAIVVSRPGAAGAPTLSELNTFQSTYSTKPYKGVI